MKHFLGSVFFCILIVSNLFAKEGDNNLKQKKILVLVSYNITLPWERDFIGGLEKSIKKQALDYEFYFEIIDTNRLGKYYNDTRLLEHIKEKYHHVTFDAIIAESDRASSFLNRYKNLLNPKIPLVFYITKHNTPDNKSKNIFIVSDSSKQISQKTAQMALRYNPKLKDVYIINGGDFLGEYHTKSFQKFFQKYPGIKVHVLQSFLMEDVYRILSKVDKESAVFYTLVFKDRSQKQYIPKNVLKKICSVTKVPVYSLYSTLLGTGTIGGNMVDASQLSDTIIKALEEYFKKASFPSQSNLPVSKNFVDFKVFKQYDFKDSSIQKDTVITDSPQSLFMHYKDILTLIVLFILFLITVIIYLLYRRNKEQYLIEKETKQILLDQQKEIEILKKRFQNMFINHDAIMLLIDPKTGKILDVNKSAVKFYGYSYDEFTTMNVAELNILTPKEIQNRMDEANSLEHNYFEFPHKLKNGEVKIVEVHSSPIEVDEGMILFSIIKDITKVKEYEESLKQTNRRLKELSKAFENEKLKYQKLMENSSDAISIMDIEGNLIEYSKVTKSLLGYSDKEMLKLSVFDWDKSMTKKQYQELINTIDYFIPISLERVHTRKDGTTYYADITAIKVELDSKQYIYASVRDITTNKKLQEEIEAQKKEFETIFKYAEDGIAVIDLEGRFLKFNTAFLKLSDYTEEELFKKNCNDLTALEDREKNRLAIEKSIQSGYVENFEKTCIMNHNKRVTVHVSISLLPDKQSLLLIVKDTSALKLLEEQAKLASMGEMIGNIAHQWRQPLSIITSSASGMRMQAQYGMELTDEKIEEFSDVIVQQAQYLSNTIDNFRDFLKGDKDYKDIEVNEVIEYTLSLVHASIKNNNIRLIKEVDSDLMINGSINELSEAFINIINNSKDILKEKVEDQEKRLIFIYGKRVDNSKIEITFKDSGGGIADNILDRIFEPYFTSKHQSIGTGLGLSMAEKIIRERHNGSISAYNEEYEYQGETYKGACFKVILNSI